MAWAYAADSAQTTHAGYRRSHVVCEAWTASLLLHTDDKLDIYIYIYRGESSVAQRVSVNSWINFVRHLITNGSIPEDCL